jgi:drug/metabolite transporter (DMT)-like permease
MLSRPLAALCLVAAMALTGSNVAFGKAIAAFFPVYIFMLFRFAIASLALAPLALAEPGPRLARMSRREGSDLALMALLGLVGFTALMLEGLKRTAAAETSAAGGGSLAGNALIAGAVVCEGSFVVLGKRLAPPYRPLRLALGTNLAGLLLALPLALLDVPAFDVRSVPIEMWLLGVWYALSASVFALWLWYAGLPHVETWLAGLATASMPVSALAVSGLYLGEPIGTARVAGASLVIAAIVLGAISPVATRADRGPPRAR